MTRLASVAATIAAALALGILAVHPAPVAGVPTMGEPVAACMSEDGSDPRQTFPCRWDAASMCNGRGESYTLSAPTSDI